MKQAPTVLRPAGFALVELVVVMLTTGLLAGVLFGGVLALRRALLPPVLELDGEILSESPTCAVMPAALDFHRLFLEHWHGSRVAYVFGGRVLGDGRAGRPLKRTSLPDLGALVKGLPAEAAAFQELYSEQLGLSEEEAGDGDFTILLMGARTERLAAICLVQCRSRRFSLEGRPGVWIRREASLVDEQGNQARYVFAEPGGSEGGSQVGALHVRHRSLSVNGAREEGPAFVVFPDPWLFRGRVEAAAVPQHSRFMYFIPVERS